MKGPKAAHRKTRLAAIAVLIMALLGLGACSVEGTAVGAAAGAGIMASQERGFEQGIVDQRIRVDINSKWLQHDAKMYRLLSLQVQEGRVLISGAVPTQEMRIDAVRLAWEVEGVKEVINEVTVSNEGGVGTYARDTWISTQLKTKLVFDSEVSSINYSIETVHGVVYLMGVAKDAAELERVVNHARNISYVERVVSYVRVETPPDGTQAVKG
jgi:osmotically-inducible protein OsmY